MLQIEGALQPSPHLLDEDICVAWELVMNRNNPTSLLKGECYRLPYGKSMSTKYGMQRFMRT